MSYESRAEQIQERLVAFFASMDVLTATPLRDAWDCFPITDHHRYGWITPIPFGEPPLIACFCPELIAEQTEWLDDEQLDTYLNILEYTMSRHLALFGEGGVAENHRLIEDEILTNWPSSMHLLNAVQLRALDSKA